MCDIISVFAISVIYSDCRYRRRKQPRRHIGEKFQILFYCNICIHLRIGAFDFRPVYGETLNNLLTMDEQFLTKTSLVSKQLYV